MLSSGAATTQAAASAGDAGAGVPALSALLAEHRRTTARLREQAERDRRAAVAAVGAVSDGLARQTNDGVARIFVTQVCLCSVRSLKSG